MPLVPGRRRRRRFQLSNGQRLGSTIGQIQMIFFSDFFSFSLLALLFVGTRIQDHRPLRRGSSCNWYMDIIIGIADCRRRYLTCLDFDSPFCLGDNNQITISSFLSLLLLHHHPIFATLCIVLAGGLNDRLPAARQLLLHSIHLGV